jgi:hypothetical protein
VAVFVCGLDFFVVRRAPPASGDPGKTVSGVAVLQLGGDVTPLPFDAGTCGSANAAAELASNAAAAEVGGEPATESVFEDDVVDVAVAILPLLEVVSAVVVGRRFANATVFFARFGSDEVLCESSFRFVLVSSTVSFVVFSGKSFCVCSGASGSNEVADDLVVFTVVIFRLSGN